MNTQILKKCLLELESETPRIDYVKGMLETLIEMQGPHSSVAERPVVSREVAGAIPAVVAIDPEREILESSMKANIDRLKAEAAQANA